MRTNLLTYSWAVIVLSALCLSACVGNSIKPSGEACDTDTIVTVVTVVDTTTIKPDSAIAVLSPQQVDSLYFRLTHHYSQNFNFLVKADSLLLVPREADLFPSDTAYVYKDELIVVADIAERNDTTWIKVAHDQMTMGWIAEKELLQNATPDDQISEMLYMLSSSRGIWMSILAALGLVAIFLRRLRHHSLLIFQYNEMRSPYPQIFLVVVAMLASIYASVQNLVPEYWQEYYFHPSLNPFVLPPVMAALVVCVWLTIICFIAVVDEVYNHFYALQGLHFLVELIGVSMIVYLVISWTTLFYVGYLLLPMFIYANYWLYKRAPLPTSPKGGA